MRARVCVRMRVRPTLGTAESTEGRIGQSSQVKQIISRQTMYPLG